MKIKIAYILMGLTILIIISMVVVSLVFMFHNPEQTITQTVIELKYIYLVNLICLIILRFCYRFIEKEKRK